MEDLTYLLTAVLYVNTLSTTVVCGERAIKCSLVSLQEIDSIEMSKDDDDVVTKDAVAAADDGIDGIPIPADSGAAAAVTPVENGKKVLEKVSAKVSAKTSSQPINDVDSEEDDEFKAVAPQGLLASVFVVLCICIFFVKFFALPLVSFAWWDWSLTWLTPLRHNTR